jgi:hypothetical protein
VPQDKSDQTVVIGVAVAEVRHRNVLLAPIIAAIEFFLSPQLSGSFLAGDVDTVAASAKSPKLSPHTVLLD